MRRFHERLPNGDEIGTKIEGWLYSETEEKWTDEETFSVYEGRKNTLESHCNCERARADFSITEMGTKGKGGRVWTQDGDPKTTPEDAIAEIW